MEIKELNEVKYNNFGSKMILKDYNGYYDVTVYFPEYDWTFYKARMDKFKDGQLRCPYEPRIYNKGYLGEGKYKPYINRKATRIYQTWKDMLRRCYSEEYQLKKPTYKGCKVCDEWLNFQNFAEWYEENYYDIENQRMALDKDIIIKRNKIYSPETCVFVPERINSLFTKNNKSRGDYPIGVSTFKGTNIIGAWCQNNSGNPVCLGEFNTIEEAFQAYKTFKEDYIKQVADEYKELIPSKLYDALYRYEVEIND